VCVIYTTVVRASQDRSVTVDVEWRPFLVDALKPGDVPTAVRGLAACEAVRRAHRAEYDKFAAAMLTLAYEEQDEPGAAKTLAVAAQVAGLEADVVTSAVVEAALDQLEETSDAARRRGVKGVPTVERHGPPLLVRTSGAADHGNSVARLELINRMLDEDGIWAMTKP
jgi:protein-disulfide isomerase-like protein with CxxC motif